MRKPKLNYIPWNWKCGRLVGSTAAWNATWVNEVRRQAGAVWVRFAGLHEVPIVGTGLGNRFVYASRWMVPGVGEKLQGYRTAVINVRCRGTQHVGLAGRIAWAELGPDLVPRMATTLIQVRELFALPLGVLAEDFTARWYLECGQRADFVALDNPILSIGEARDRYAAGLCLPGVVRRSAWVIDREWDLWRMHFPMDQLAARNCPRVGRHGYWDIKDVLSLRPIIAARRAVDTQLS